jgi:hypothetical protein
VAADRLSAGSEHAPCIDGEMCSIGLRDAWRRELKTPIEVEFSWLLPHKPHPQTLRLTKPDFALMIVDTEIGRPA